MKLSPPLLWIAPYAEYDYAHTGCIFHLSVCLFLHQYSMVLMNIALQYLNTWQTEVSHSLFDLFPPILPSPLSSSLPQLFFSLELFHILNYVVTCHFPKIPIGIWSGSALNTEINSEMNNLCILNLPFCKHGLFLHLHIMSFSKVV